MTDIELLLRQALAPVDPPADLEERLEGSLTTIVEAAADELEAWELSSLTDPRNWARAGRGAAVVAVGGAAAVGLVVVRTQRKRHRRAAAADNTLDLARRTVRDLAQEANKLIDEAARRR